MLVLGPVLCAAAWCEVRRFGPRSDSCWDASIAYLNFQWLKSGVSASQTAYQRRQTQSGKGIVARFLLRYVLLGLAAYAILTSFSREP